MADAICPFCQSTEIVALGFMQGMRALRIRCTDCGRDAHLPYPRPSDGAEGELGMPAANKDPKPV